MHLADDTVCLLLLQAALLAHEELAFGIGLLGLAAQASCGNSLGMESEDGLGLAHWENVECCEWTQAPTNHVIQLGLVTVMKVLLSSGQRTTPGTDFQASSTS